MPIELWLRERFGPRVQYQDGSCLVQSGSPARYRLSADRDFTKSISAMRALVERPVLLRLAKAEIERVLVGEAVVVDLPMLEDAAIFKAEMRELGVSAVPKETAAAAEG